MALKNPSELFGGSAPKKTSINIDQTHIKEEFTKVEELRKQLDDVSSSLNNSLTEVVDKNLNFLSNEYYNLLDKFNNKINIFKEEIGHKVDDLKKSNQYLRTEVEIVEQRQNSINLGQIKREVLSEVQTLLSGDVSENIRRLEEKIEVVRDSYQQTLNEGLLNEPPSTDNGDPLTPLDQNFATMDDLQNHYRLFLNRVQQQIATIGGGGAVNIQDMDDVDVATAKVNNNYLKYDSSTGKWKGAAGTGAGANAINDLSDVTISGASSGQVLKFNGSAWINDTDATGGGGGSQNLFQTIAVSGQSNVVADSTTDTLTFAAGSNMTITTNASNDTITFASSGGGGGSQNLFSTIAVSGQNNIVADSTTDTLTFVAGSNVTLTTNDSTDSVTISAVGAGDTTHVRATTLTVAGVTTHYQDVQFPGAAYNILWDQATSKIKFDDSAQCVWGSASGGDLRIWHASDVSNIKNETGQLRIAGNDIRLQTENNSEDYILCTDGGDVKIFFNDAEKLATTNTGITVTGDVEVSDTIFVANNIRHTGDTDTYLEFTDDQIRIIAGGKALIHAEEGTIDTVVINDGSNDLDFRVEGQNDEHLIFSDGSTDRVGIGSATPTQKLDVDGNVKATTYYGDGSNLTGISAGALDSRGTTSAATGSIAQTASANITIPTRGKSFSLLKVAIDAPAWVILYVDTASRTADASRSEGTDPAPGSGVLTEVSTTTAGASTFLMSPGVLGWNNDGTPAAQVYAKVTNKRATSGSNAITVTLTTVGLEA